LFPVSPDAIWRDCRLNSILFVTIVKRRFAAEIFGF